MIYHGKRQRISWATCNIKYKANTKILPLAEQACFDQRKEESVMVEKVAGNRGVGSPVKSSWGLEWMEVTLIP